MKRVFLLTLVIVLAFCLVACGSHSYDDGYDAGYQAGLSEGYENGFEDGSIETDTNSFDNVDTSGLHIVPDGDFYNDLVDFMNSGYADDPGMMSDFINGHCSVEY